MYYGHSIDPDALRTICAQLRERFKDVQPWRADPAMIAELDQQQRQRRKASARAAKVSRAQRAERAERAPGQQDFNLDKAA